MMLHVLTLSWNGLDKLKKLQPGLISNLTSLNMPFTWYVRDNGSTDGSVDWLRNLNDPNIQVMSVEHNRDNFAQGINSLAALAQTNLNFNAEEDLILLINNDVEFTEDPSLKKIMALLTEEVGVVGCRLLYNGTNNLQHAGVIFSQKYGNMPYHYRHQELSDSLAEKNRYFQAVTAAVCLLKFKDFLTIGGMDQGFNWAFEDISMCLEIKALGYKIAYCGETFIYHEESATLKKNPVNKMFMSSNVRRFKSKWFGKYEIDHDKYLQDTTYNEIKKT